MVLLRYWRVALALLALLALVVAAQRTSLYRQLFFAEPPPGPPLTWGAGLQEARRVGAVLQRALLVIVLLGAGCTAALLFALAVTGNLGVVRACVLYWRVLRYFWRGGTLSDCRLADKQVLVHVYSLCCITRLWTLPHYRNGTFQQDMARNLRNVALPGTGLPLSMLCHSYYGLVLFLVFGYPLVALVAAYFRFTDNSLAAQFRYHLLTPRDWFSLWRLNCRLASLHAHITGSNDYKMEDKWEFLCEANRQGIPVTPCLSVPSIVVKNKNEEGGMGINFFSNALHGGDWIIQKTLDNSAFVAGLLPKHAPLSTLRLVTASRGALGETAKSSKDLVTVLSCVFRAGRENARTDHQAVLFDVDMKTGTIRKGTTNAEWYQLGPQHMFRRPTPADPVEKHPDCGAQLSGVTIPHFEQVLQLVQDAHFKTCPEVPLCGWDVALTSHPDEGVIRNGIMLLEVNLSCNFFQATLDYDKYLSFVHECFVHLEQTGSA